MAIISRRHRYLFLMAPRTGCTAIGERVLIAELDGEYLPPDDVVAPDGTAIAPKKHSTLAHLHRAGLLEPADLNSLFVFTTVRNPFDSLVSQYVKMRTSYAPLLDDPDSFVQRDPGYRAAMVNAADMSFAQWVRAQYVGRHVHQLRQRSTWHAPIPWLARGWAGPRHMYGGFLEGAHQVMRFERLQRDFDLALAHLGLPPHEIPPWNVTEAKTNYRDYYDDDARALVAHVFAPDLQRFGYSF